MAADEQITYRVSDNRGKAPKLISESGLYKLVAELEAQNRATKAVEISAIFKVVVA